MFDKHLKATVAHNLSDLHVKLIEAQAAAGYLSEQLAAAHERLKQAEQTITELKAAKTPDAATAAEGSGDGR